MAAANSEQQVAGESMIIELISECFVKARHEVEAAKQPHYLSPIELALLSIDPIQKGLLFTLHPPNPDTTTVPSLVDKLKQSVSAALVYFYPLAGRLATERYEEEHACWVYVDCNKGPGARVIHAAAPGLTVSDILSPPGPGADVPKVVQSLFDLGERTVNHDGHTKPLLSIQVTELRDGVFIGFTINHCVADGTSFAHFIHVLSEIFMREGGDSEYGLPPSRLPLYKFYAPEGHGPVVKLPYLGPEEFVTRYDPGPLRERIFHFSPAAVARLKARANQEECSSNGDRISSYMALSALVWRSITRARGAPPDQETGCQFLVNARPRVDPPLSDNYFGNLLGYAKGTCKVDELLGRPLGWAAALLRQEVSKCNQEAISYLLKFLADSPMVLQPGLVHTDVYGPNTVVFGGSPRFDMYGPEFGLGRAVAVRMGCGNRDHAKVTANPGREGGGSVDLEICLRPQTMDALELDEDFMSYVSHDDVRLESSSHH